MDERYFLRVLCVVFLCVLCGLIFYHRGHKVFHREHKCYARFIQLCCTGCEGKTLGGRKIRNTKNKIAVPFRSNLTVMEVHHHGHVHHQSRWKEYLFQFFMLFLAVFLGFLAEYRFEHSIEHKRTVQLAENLYKELKSDSLRVQRVLEDRSLKEHCLEYLRDYFKDSSLTKNSRKVSPCMGLGVLLSLRFLFEPNDGVLSQLRYSGTLRYFQDPDIQQHLGDLMVAINNIRLRNEQEYNFYEETLRPFLFKHYDYEWYQVITQNGTIPAIDALKNYMATDSNKFEGRLKNSSSFDRDGAYSITSHYLLMLRGSRNVQLTPYIEANSNLLKELRKNYKIKD